MSGRVCQKVTMLDDDAFQGLDPSNWLRRALTVTHGEDKNERIIRKRRDKEVDFWGKSVTHLFRCETSYMFSLQQIFLLSPQAPPLIKDRTFKWKNEQTMWTIKEHCLCSLLYTAKSLEIQFQAKLSVQVISRSWYPACHFFFIPASVTFGVMGVR